MVGGKTMSLKNLGDVTYFRLNNEINRPVNGVIPLQKDKEAIKAFYKENVEPNLLKFNSYKEKIDYLIEHDYIEEGFIKKYKIEFIEFLYNWLKEQNFQFKSFMGAYKFHQQYALKTDDGESYLETVEDRVLMNALYFADGDEELAKDIANEMIHMRYQPATPTYLNAGRKRRGEFVSCFLLQVTDDMNSIGRSINSALQLSRIGGGVGISLSNLREAGAPIKGFEGAASGVVPVMKLFEDSFSYSNQLGQRQGAGAVYLNVFHPDIIAFLSTKKENADEKVRVKTLSLGLVVPDKFYELARKNEEMYLFSPYSVEKVYGVPFSYIDITKEYDNLVKNPLIRKTKIVARELEEEISKLQQESGYPYIVNIDHANDASAFKTKKILMSNLCSEILQPQEVSEINDSQEFTKLGTDISCNLGSLNMVNLMESEDVGKTIRIATRALTWVSDNSNIEVVPTVKNGNEKAHSIGLGLMGLASYFAMNQVEYGSKESLEITSQIFEIMNYWTLYESNQIAKERGIKFDGFEDTTYADGSYFEKYISLEYEERNLQKSKAGRKPRNLHDIYTSLEMVDKKKALQAEKVLEVTYRSSNKSLLMDLITKQYLMAFEIYEDSAPTILNFLWEQACLVDGKRMYTDSLQATAQALDLSYASVQKIVKKMLNKKLLLKETRGLLAFNGTLTDFFENLGKTPQIVLTFEELENEHIESIAKDNKLSPKVANLFKDVFCPSINDWMNLRESVMKYGVYSESRMAVAPNGSISYINDCSSSIHPIINRIEERQEKKIGKIYYPARGLSTETIPFYKSAYDTDMRKVIDVYAEATKHVDQGLSLTLFIRSEIPEGLYEWKGENKKQTTRDLSILRNYAFNKGIKSIYYVRTFTDDGGEVGSNQCESCTI